MWQTAATSCWSAPSQAQTFHQRSDRSLCDSSIVPTNAPCAMRKLKSDTRNSRHRCCRPSPPSSVRKMNFNSANRSVCKSHQRQLVDSFSFNLLKHDKCSEFHQRQLVDSFSFNLLKHDKCSESHQRQLVDSFSFNLLKHDKCSESHQRQLVDSSIRPA